MLDLGEAHTLSELIEATHDAERQLGEQVWFRELKGPGTHQRSRAGGCGRVARCAAVCHQDGCTGDGVCVNSSRNIRTQPL